MTECPYCGDARACKNDVLQCIIVNHGANMDRWDGVNIG